MHSVRIVLTPGELKDTSIEKQIIIVIDTLRASTTIITALANGITAVLPFSTRTELIDYYNNEVEKDKLLLAGEYEGKRIIGFDLGNSPLAFINKKYNNNIVLLKTSNGTKVLNSISDNNIVYIGGLVNSKAIVRLIKDKQRDVYLVCAGSYGTFSLEDFFAAGRYCCLLKREGWQGDDLTVAAARIYEDNSEYDDIVKLFYHSRNGQNLLDLGYEKDIKFCSRVDIIDIAPVFDGKKIMKEDRILSGI
ncbi:MAG: 2-phosphosulfolactate phosphatase [Halanaerobiales bacterium]